MTIKYKIYKYRLVIGQCYKEGRADTDKQDMARDYSHRLGPGDICYYRDQEGKKSSWHDERDHTISGSRIVETHV